MNKSYYTKLLNNWEDVYRQGLLTFWIFVALKDDRLDVQHIRQKIAELTDGSYVATEQTLYRVLRKNYELELVDFTEIPTEKGPKKKLYSLSALGHRLLEDFVNRNISLFNQPIINDLIRSHK